MVTSKNVGLAVPDWPTTFGYNMFLFPVSKWVGGILFEHTHRLMGSVVGFLTIILAVWLWLREDRPWVRSLGVIALGGVILQGILGGLRVTMMKDEIGIFHACIAQAFLGLLVVIALVTTNFWRMLTDQRIDAQKFAPIKTLAITITIAIYVQLALGATMRHQHRDLAILDFLGRAGRMSGCAWRMDDLEQQSSRRGDCACRPRRRHAIFWREHFCDLLANFTKSAWASGSRRSWRAAQRARSRMKTAAL